MMSAGSYFLGGLALSVVVPCVYMPRIKAALPHCTAMASLCIRYVLDFSSPVTQARRPPKSFRKDKDSGPKTPDVSIATGVTV